MVLYLPCHDRHLAGLAAGAELLICIYACGLPARDDDWLRRFCRELEDMIDPRLEPAQHIHIKSFASHGPALRARSLRAIAALLALRHLPREARLDRTPEGRPLAPAGKNISIAFAYSANTAFCALHHNDGAAHIPLAVDVEVRNDQAVAASIPCYLRKLCGASPGLPQEHNLQIWTAYEAAVKICGMEGASSFLRKLLLTLPRGTPQTGNTMIDGKHFCWRNLPFLGHWVCVAICKSRMPNITLHARHILSMIKWHNAL